MDKAEVIEEWIRGADEEFDFAVACLKNSDKFFSQICFHFYQAVEKYLKAFIVANGLEFEKIHDLVKLLNICKKKEPSLAGLREACEFLNPFYIETRYPIHWPIQHTKEEAQKAQAFARTVRDVIKSFL